VQAEEASPGRRRTLIIVSAFLFVVAGLVLWWRLSGKKPEDIAAVRIYMCSETGKIFEHRIREGEEEPIESPHSGKKSGYLPEACYWTKGPDGKYKAKLKPTYVILETKLTPGVKKKTICPDCGREVTGHNRMPSQKLMQAAREEAGVVQKD